MGQIVGEGRCPIHIEGQRTCIGWVDWDLVCQGDHLDTEEYLVARHGSLVVGQRAPEDGLAVAHLCT